MMKRNRLHSTCVSLVLSLLLAACGGGGGGGGSDTTAPTAAISFPGSVALTQASSILTTGTAGDAGAITGVSVDGTAATTTDAYANGRVEVPLAPGVNTLSVRTTDEFSNTDPAATTLTVTMTDPFLVTPTAMALDSANGRALVLDAGLDAVVAVDLSSGARTVLSDATTPPGGVNPFAYPQGITLDSANSRVLVADSNLDAVVAVDLTTGSRTILSDATTPDAVNPFSWPGSITLDSTNNRALVLDTSLSAVVAVELTSGSRVIISK